MPVLTADTLSFDRLAISSGYTRQSSLLLKIVSNKPFDFSDNSLS